MKGADGQRTRLLSRLAATAPSAFRHNSGLPRPLPETASHGIAAAVLVPVMDRPGGLTILLTRRAETLRDHAGQISFPGGRLEPGDSGPVAAALRESMEEIGLPGRHVRVLGRLDRCMTGTGFSIVPVVGLVRPLFRPQPDPAEVAEVFEVPLAHLARSASYRRRPRVAGGKTWHMHEIRYRHHHIWGATASILLTLARILEET